MQTLTEKTRRTRVLVAAVPLCVSCFFLGWFLLDVYRTGSATLAARVWQGESLVWPDSLEVESPGPGTRKRLTLPIYNSLDKDVRIVGGTVTCSCVVVDDLPVIIGARSRVDIPLTVRSLQASKRESSPENFVFLYTDLPESPVLKIAVRLRGRERPDARPARSRSAQ